MGQSRVQQLGERITDSGFVRNVIGPKVLEPVTVWYEENLRDGTDEQPDAKAGDSAGDVIDLTDEAPRHDTLESARAAERFLEGDAQDPPVARIRPNPAAAPAAATAAFVAAPDPDPTTELPETAAAVPATRPAVGGWRGARDIAMRVKDRVKHHNLNVVAAGIAFWSLLAIPAVLTSIVSIYGLVASPDEVEDQINDLMSGVSEEARTVVSDQLENITSGSSGGLAAVAVIGIVLALWSASGAVAKLITTMNTIWEVREDRKFFALRGVAVALTFGAIVFFLSTVAALAIVPAILGETALGDVARWTINLARFPALLVFMMVGLTFLYWFGPNRHAKWRLLTWGAFIATVGWLVLSGLFSIYTANFAQYNETYAAMGSVVVLLLWMFITAFMVLVGAEIDAAREERDAELAAFDAAH
ncbi:MAG: YihY/virulence factor BrkB family protein [Acidimicrobiales bacterium]